MLHDLGAFARSKSYESRSICAENPTGAKAGGGRAPVPIDEQTGQPTGPARELGLGWKVRPCRHVAPGEVFEMADIEGPGTIQSMWITPAGVANRDVILRIYWDGQTEPSVEVPMGDFFASAFTSKDVFAPIDSALVAINPGSAFNCFWPMPFRRHCRMAVENRDPNNDIIFFYQVNYALGPVADDALYFHAQFRRTNPLPYGRVYTILDNVRGSGHYAGTYMAWGLNNNSWWGEGEIKFYIDGDLPEGRTIDEAAAEHGGDCFPTICGTGTEDYFGGSYNFENRATKSYQEYTTQYMGVPHIVRPDGTYQANTRFSMYRWHVPDPVVFREDLAIAIQAIGWRREWRYLPLQDDMASTAFWYQTLPSPPFPVLGDRNALEII